MEDENIKSLVEKAKEAVDGLEEPLKTEGFKIILAKFIDSNEKGRSKAETKSQKRKETSTSSERGDNVVEQVCNKVNRTEHSEIYNMKKALDRSLLILKIARDDVGIDGLLPLQIAKILSIIFKLRATSAAVGMALGAATTYVDRKQVVVQGGMAYKYYLMYSGEQHLETLLKGEQNG